MARKEQTKTTLIKKNKNIIMGTIALLIIGILIIVLVVEQQAQVVPPKKLTTAACTNIKKPFWAISCEDAFVSAYRTAVKQIGDINVSEVTASLRVTPNYGRYVFRMRIDRNYVCAYVNAIDKSDVNIIIGKKC